MDRDEEPPAAPLRQFITRGYQQELLHESLRRNVVIALDTGSGKTHIAVLRMKHEVERDTKKTVWFIAPTVALIEQQREVIRGSIPVPVGLVSGQSEPDQWKDAKVWKKLLEDHPIMVSTPQILLDALRHGFLSLGNVSLLVFDEAHHATLKHPYNTIMQDFYFKLPARNGSTDTNIGVRPMILGLTASPIYGGDVAKAFRELEANLDCVILSSRANRDELAQHVHRPIFKQILWEYPSFSYEEIPWSGPAANVIALNTVYQSLDINEDPYVISLRKQLAKLGPSNARTRLDQKLSKTIDKKDTFSHKGIRDFRRAACDICWELGPWAADWYVSAVIKQANSVATVNNIIMTTWKEQEKDYLLSALKRVQLTPVSTDPQYISSRVSIKVRKLIGCLVDEENLARLDNEPYSGIVFVTRRDSVLALSHLLSCVPETAGIFRIGCLLGSSTSSKRHSFLDITRVMVKDSPGEILADFKLGEKNLIVSTSVAEEGIDIQACGSVIRFDPPQNMVSWAQSRGRARRKKSTYVLFEDASGAASKIQKWQNMESEMVAKYNDQHRLPDEPMETVEEIEYDMEFRVEETGALLTLDGVISYLYHFCSILPSSGHGSHLPIFDLDPPDYPEGWHEFGSRTYTSPYQGPWTATCILPRILPPHLRTFTSHKPYRSKLSARCHAAFRAYVQLYNAGLLNSHLLPLLSAIENDVHEEVKLLLKDVTQRASTANVSLQIDPFAVPTPIINMWWSYRLAFGDEHDLFMFVPIQLPSFDPDDLPLLYVPGKKPFRVTLVPGAIYATSSKIIAAAQSYTHRILFSIYGSPRVKGDDRDFIHLFLPVQEDRGLWDDRRLWHTSKATYDRHENQSQVNARTFGSRTGYSVDLAIIRENDKSSKALRFLGWHDGPISREEEEWIRERYDGYDNVEIIFPLLVVQSLPRRENFLVPLQSETAGLSKDDPWLVLPEHATVDLISLEEAEIAKIIPSFLRGLPKAMTTISLRDKLFTDPILREIPLELLTTAITSPITGETHYQRLETLGDTVLKYTISIQLFADHPYWHEGYLSKRKDHAVSNSQLAKEAIGKGLYEYIIRDRFAPKKWKPRYLSDKPLVEPIESPEEAAKEVQTPQPEQGPPPPATTNGTQDETANGTTEPEKPKRKKKQNRQELSTKVLADVVEALIGAAYEHGGFDIAIKCIETFGLGIPLWQSIPTRIETILSRLEPIEEPPPQLTFVEQILDYEFTHKTLLIEALTHASYQGAYDNVSYERLEFLGDAALDMIVTDYLYHAPGKNYSPGHMHMRKEALVNSHLLAFLCVDNSLVLDAPMPSFDAVEGLTFVNDDQTLPLYRCLMHSSTRVLEDQHVAFTRYQKIVSAAKESLSIGKVYPWSLLTSVLAPKFISDMIESLLGAVFLDSRGDLNAVRRVLNKLGHQAIMEHIVRDDVDVIHPISRIAIWAARPDDKKKLEIKMEKIKGNVSCTITLDGTEVTKASERYRGKATRNHVRFAAAGEAIAKLHILEEEKPEDVDEVGWPSDVPEYEY
ncbi:hypothetical protein QCA50_019269 [Cerrena zonata]|uniref:P-loop containing nucleoside triphosphate hydrolase protein n=1 Tax=Cerrena zonata TaxID=2478898 RepID=A0AAW0FET7_9APHY